MDESAIGSGGDARAGDPGDGGADPELDVVCRQVVELVTDYLEGALPHRVRAAVERHLRVCPPCVLYVEQIRATAASVREVPVESIDPSTRAHLVSAFRDLIPKSGRDPA